MARKSRRTQRLRVVARTAQRIDIGKDRHFVAVDPERTEEPVRSALISSAPLPAIWRRWRRGWRRVG